MLNSVWKTAVPTIIAGLFFAALAVAGKGKTIEIHPDAVLPDGQELKAGDYQVVVSAGEDEIRFMKSGQVVAKHACKCMGHEGGKNRYNQVRYSETPDKKQKVTEIRLAGTGCVLNLDIKGGM